MTSDQILRLVDCYCEKCGKHIGRVDGRYEIKCPKCHTMNLADTADAEYKTYNEER